MHWCYFAGKFCYFLLPYMILDWFDSRLSFFCYRTFVSKENVSQNIDLSEAVFLLLMLWNYVFFDIFYLFLNSFITWSILWGYVFLIQFPSLDTGALKMSGIGRAVMLLYKHPRESKENRHIAGKIVGKARHPDYLASFFYNFLHVTARPTIHSISC